MGALGSRDPAQLMLLLWAAAVGSGVRFRTSPRSQPRPGQLAFGETMRPKTRPPAGVVARSLWQIAVMVLLSLSLPRTARGETNEKDKAALESVMAEAKKEVDEKVAKDPAAEGAGRQVPARDPALGAMRGWKYLGAAYSFIYETADDKENGNNVQLIFDNGGYKGSFNIRGFVSQSNLAADLGMWSSRRPRPQTGGYQRRGTTHLASQPDTGCRG